MPNIAKVLREEIQRLAKKQVKADVRAIKRESVRLKKSVADLRRQVAALNHTSSELLKKITPVVTTQEIEDATEHAAKLRPTAASLKKLRARLGLTQAQFGQLLGVSGQAVVQWGSREGRVRMRQTTLAALARIQNIGKREALRRLAAIDETTPSRGRGREK